MSRQFDQGDEVYIEETFVLSREDHLYGIGISYIFIFTILSIFIIVSMTTSFFLYIFKNSLFSDFPFLSDARFTFIQTLFFFAEFLMLRFNYAEKDVLIID